MKIQQTIEFRAGVALVATTRGENESLDSFLARLKKLIILATATQDSPET